MFARVVEMLLACWLAISPFVFGHAEGAPLRLYTDLVCALVVAVLAGTAMWPRFRRLHLAELLPAAWLVVAGWGLAASEPSAAAQNELIVGLLIAMFAIIPGNAEKPPEGWVRFYEERGEA